MADNEREAAFLQDLDALTRKHDVHRGLRMLRVAVAERRCRPGRPDLPRRRYWGTYRSAGEDGWRGDEIGWNSAYHQCLEKHRKEWERIHNRLWKDEGAPNSVA